MLGPDVGCILLTWYFEYLKGLVIYLVLDPQLLIVEMLDSSNALSLADCNGT